jgi:hypothetical protein
VVGAPFAEARVGALLLAHRHRDRIEHMERVLDGLLVARRRRHRRLRQVDAQEPFVRVPRAWHGGGGPREALLPQVVAHVRDLPREGRLVGEDTEGVLAVVVVVVQLRARLHELDDEPSAGTVTHLP